VPDSYCITQPDGSCISEDPRCMHQPFLPRATSYSGLSTLSTCKMMFYYAYVLRIERPGVNLPMHCGECGHAALNVLYTEKWDRKLAREAFRDAWGDVKPPLEGKYSYLTRGHGESVLEAYINDREENPTMLEEASVFEGAEKLQTFDWASPEGTGEVLTLRGAPDLPVMFPNGGLYVVDHKWTTMWVNSWWEKQFKVGHQVKVYTKMQEETTGLRFDGAYINAVYMGKTPKSPWDKLASSPNKLIQVDFTPAHLDETWKWARGLQEIEKTCEKVGIWPQDEKACGNYGGCEFLELCEASPGALRESLIRRNFRVREERK